MKRRKGEGQKVKTVASAIAWFVDTFITQPMTEPFSHYIAGRILDIYYVFHSMLEPGEFGHYEMCVDSRDEPLSYPFSHTFHCFFIRISTSFSRLTTMLRSASAIDRLVARRAVAQRSTASRTGRARSVASPAASCLAAPLTRIRIDTRQLSSTPRRRNAESAFEQGKQTLKRGEDRSSYKGALVC